MITVFVYDKKISKAEFSPSLVKQYLAKKNAIIWVDLHNPTKKEHEAIKGSFGIHPLVIEDCSKAHTRPKVELFPNYNFIVTNGVHHKEASFKLVEFDFILGKNFLVSNHFGPADNIDQLKAGDRLGLIM